MAGRSTFSVKFDTSELVQLGENLADITPKELGARLVETTNQQIESAYDLSRKRMLSGINLTDSYLQDRFEINKATTNRPTGEIIAKARDKGDLTLLSRYGLEVETGRVNWSNERIAAEGHKFGKWPGWVRRKGNEKLGIPEGRKQIAPSVEVVRGKRESLKSKKAFVFISDSGTPLVVKRKPNGKLTSALKGPSVYQLFRIAATDLEERIGDDYQAAITDAAEAELKKVLG